MFDKVVATIQSYKAHLAVAVVLITIALVVDFLWFPVYKTATFSNGVTISITEDKCELKNVLEVVRPDLQDQLKAAIVRLPAALAKRLGLPEEFKACVITINGQVLGMDENDIDFGPIPESEFK